ncbi:AAA family ATPase [Blautia sp. JLR.GB0024]|uniref:AAA family ATPase n=1 Tax=Blautia sp. JLR.GB0024 TaxID=3123295 RepID=UPI0030066E59
MEIRLKKLTLQNFMNYHEKSVDFAEITKIIGKNGKGKSSILTGYTWLLFNCDYELRDNPKIRREIDGVAVADMDVSVEGVFEFNGKEVVVKKVQKRKFGRDGVSYSDNNTYFINEVPKTMRDFNDYFDLDMDVFKICSSINAFLAKKPKEMRDFLFGTVDSVTNLDVSEKFGDLAELVPLLQQYELEEIVAMNKASKAKISKELPILEGQIKEKERDCAVVIDTAELELQANYLREQIDITERQMEDTSSAIKEYDKVSTEIIRVKGRMREIIDKANASLHEERNSIQKRIDEATEGVEKSRNQVKLSEMRIEQLKKTIEQNEAEKIRLHELWKEEKGKTYPEYEEIPEFDENALICPTCGQMLPDELKQHKLTDYEEQKCKSRISYDNAKAEFEKAKNSRIMEINTQGKAVVDSIERDIKEIEQLEEKIDQIKEDAIQFSSEIVDAMEELAKSPQTPDLSDNQEYEVLQKELSNLEEAGRNMDIGAGYRKQLRTELSGLREELSEVEKRIASADTTEAEERLEELRKNRINMEQAKADCEKILFLVDKLDKHKNEMLADSINAQFKYVDWQLWETNKSDNYKSVCIPTIDKKSLIDISSNKGNRILGRLDICNSIQKITGINCPVFLDDAESLDSENMDKSLKMMDCQMVILMVSDDEELRVEVQK